MKAITEIILLSFLISCTSCSNSSDQKVLSSGYAMLDSTLLKEVNMQTPDTISTIDPSISISMVNPETKAKEGKADSTYAVKIKNDADRSINKAKSCEQIMEDFKSIVDEVIRTKDPSLFEQRGWNKNDPFFQGCLKSDKDFQEKYYKLNDLLKSTFSK